MGIVRCDSVQRAMRDKELMPAFTYIDGHAAVYFRRIGSEASYATIIYPELLAYFEVDCLVTASIDVGLPSGEVVRMHRAELLQLMRQHIRADLE